MINGKNISGYPKHWEVWPFSEVVNDSTAGNHKIPTGDYLSSGSLPIIDQGQQLIGGYTSDSELKAGVELPAIIFGDHTRVFKFIDFDFAIGADGAKILEPKNGVKLDKKFLFHYLNNIFIESAGYSRHFKFLKEMYVPLPPLEEQKRIAAILDKADAIRRKRQQAIKLADDFLRSVFLEMFGDPVSNPKGWDKCCIGDVCEVQGGLQVSTKREGLPLLKPYLRVANVLRNKLDLSEIKFMSVTEAEASRIVLRENDILVVEGHGNKDEIGRCAIWTGDLEGVIHQNHLIRVRVKSNFVTAQLVNDFINSSGGRSQMLRSSNTTSGLNTISTGIVKSTEIYLPPIDVQISYGKICKKIADLLNKVLSSKDASNESFLSLSKKVFSGTL